MVPAAFERAEQQGVTPTLLLLTVMMNPEEPE